MLTTELAKSLARELGGWFGPPLLARVTPKELSSMVDDSLILDGRMRWGVLGATTQFERIPCILFPSNYRQGIYSTDGKLLPRLLALFGHFERAWHHTPECWRDSPADIAAFLGVDGSVASPVYVARPRLRRALPRNRSRAPAHSDAIATTPTCVTLSADCVDLLDAATIERGATRSSLVRDAVAGHWDEAVGEPAPHRREPLQCVSVQVRLGGKIREQVTATTQNRSALIEQCCWLYLSAGTSVAR